MYSTYLGGSKANWGNGIALDLDTPPNAYVVGTTTSTDFPAIALAYQGFPGNTTGLGNAFVSKLEPADAAGVALTPNTLDFGMVAEYTTENLTALEGIRAGQESRSSERHPPCRPRAHIEGSCTDLGQSTPAGEARHQVPTSCSGAHDKTG